MVMKKIMLFEDCIFWGKVVCLVWVFFGCMDFFEEFELEMLEEVVFVGGVLIFMMIDVVLNVMLVNKKFDYCYYLIECFV